MADLTYNDVQRAVQDAMRSLQNDMQRLNNTVSTIENQAQYIDDVQREIQNLENATMRHDPRSELSMQHIQADIAEMKLRIANIEKFCGEMSSYFRSKQQIEREDQEYRSVTPR